MNLIVAEHYNSPALLVSNFARADDWLADPPHPGRTPFPRERLAGVDEVSNAIQG